ncbi:hypothetical protein Deipe_3486 [Deinococcus peraridilitoris DSM 19664]|uniref:Uncharacterized protein n=1 Tax=Deinococcus peraridilitoris (strain DSM 19664 / LMG 22246 / CIP 109416 / KR-200) TaxID=937777 RepID=L0A640_DEIPD|nr:hypothetical protein Deipe_3486 [Deinococcus peraridilitoris DSM 19664]
MPEAEEADAAQITMTYPAARQDDHSLHLGPPRQVL